jgi:D-alanine-D-alanine ligase
MIRVGVVRGGISSEYDISLQSGATILDVLREHHADKYQPVDILISKDGEWHIAGRTISPERLMRDVDVIWNALHGEYGEDGQIQQLLEQLHIPYTGSGPVASAIGMNKKMTKDKARQLGVRVTDEYMIPDYRKQHGIVPEVYFKEHAQNVFLKFSPPWIIKPVSGGSSIGVSIVKTREELLNAIKKTAELSTDIIVEPYIKGRDATVAVADNFRNEKVYSFLPVEICPPSERFYDYKAKYTGESVHYSPGRFSQEEKEELQDFAKRIHEGIGLRHCSRSDFVVTPKGAYFLEVNTLPGMTGESNLPLSLEPVGSHLPEFVDHILQLALGRK